jgi:hypothetical protein
LALSGADPKGGLQINFKFGTLLCPDNSTLTSGQILLKQGFVTVVWWQNEIFWGTSYRGITDVLLLIMVDKTLLKEFQPGVVTTPLRNFFYRQNSKWPPSPSGDS